MRDSYLPIRIVPIKANEKGIGLIHISRALANHWEISEGVITVSVGKKAVLVEVLIKDIPRDQLFFSEKVLNELLLPLQTRLFIIRFSKKEKIIFLGPIIALLTEISDSNTESPSFRSVHTFSEELQHGVSKIGGFFFVFSLKGFSLDGITGYYYDEDKWIECTLPIPDVIYNRIHSRTLEKNPAFETFTEQINAFDVHLFNHRFLSKWEVNNFLENEEHLMPYLPETHLLSKERLIEMADKFEELYIKPINGSQGRNIFRLIKEENCIRLMPSTGGKEIVLKDISDLYDYISKKMNHRTFLIQQGLSLKTIEGKPLDFRILCHKNYQDIWKVTSIVARLSAENQFVSNIAQGGEILRPLQALVQCFDRSTASHQLSLMKEVALEVSNIIGQKANGITGELGIDMGVDDNGGIWVIEVNSKPSKSFEDKEQKLRPSARAIIEYCTKLSIDRLRNQGGIDL